MAALFLQHFGDDLLKSDKPYVFPSRQTGRNVAWIQKANARLNELCEFDAWFSAHDLRRTCGTGLGALGMSREIIGRVLNHADCSVTAIYDLHERFDEKKKALAKWSKHVEKVLSGKIEHGSNVIPLRAVNQ